MMDNEDEGLGEFEYECDDIDYMEEMSVERRTSSVSNNQYEMKELGSRIMNEVAKINEETGLGIDWALLLYCAAGWKK